MGESPRKSLLRQPLSRARPTSGGRGNARVLHSRSATSKERARQVEEVVSERPRRNALRSGRQNAPWLVAKVDIQRPGQRQVRQRPFATRHATRASHLTPWLPMQRRRAPTTRAGGAAAATSQNAAERESAPPTTTTHLLLTLASPSRLFCIGSCPGRQSRRRRPRPHGRRSSTGRSSARRSSRRRRSRSGGRARSDRGRPPGTARTSWRWRRCWRRRRGRRRAPRWTPARSAW